MTKEEIAEQEEIFGVQAGWARDIMLEQLSKSFKESPDGILSTESKSRLAWISAPVMRLLGYLGRLVEREK